MVYRPIRATTNVNEGLRRPFWRSRGCDTGMNQEVISVKQLVRLRSVIIPLACTAPLAASAVGP